MTTEFDKYIEEENVDQKFRGFLENAKTIEDKIKLCKAFLVKYDLTFPTVLPKNGFEQEYRDQYIPIPNKIERLVTNIEIPTMRGGPIALDIAKKELFYGMYEQLLQKNCLKIDQEKNYGMNNLRIRMEINALSDK